jgi:NADPH2:quinone reductase
MKARAVRMHSQGAPEVLVLEEIEVGAPGAGQAQIRQTAVGLNFLDVYQRSGSYPIPMPATAGNEAAGVVEAVGPDVTNVKVGDRVVYQGGEMGAYADRRNVPAWRLVRIPDGVSEEAAAAVLLKGMTVEYLLERCVSLKSGDFALMYAAAGGVGLIAGQWAKAMGVKLIGVAGGADKCKLAREAGYHTVIDRNSEDIVARVREITGGKGVPVAFDSVGKTTFDATIASLAPRGYFVSFGASSGKPPAVEAGLLQSKGSLYFTRPTLATYCSSPEDYAYSAKRVMEMLGSGAVKATIGRHYPLAEAAQAHRDLEAGKTSGSTILVP